MKYIRTYGDYESYKAEYSDTSRGFRLKPTLYKYSEAGDHVQLELDDPRKHGDSTYMEITLDSDVEFSFYIGNKSGDKQTTMNCSIDWGDGTVETKTITKDDKGFKLSHNYKAGSYKIELYDVERDYSIPGGEGWMSLITPVESVMRIVLGNSVVSIATGAFGYCSSLTSINIPESVTSIGSWTFYKCFSLATIRIPEGVRYILAGVFCECTSLTSVHIPESVTSIEYSVFTKCSSLTSINIPKGVTSIKNTFTSCSSLTSIYIPEGVTNIGNSAFGNCSSLTSINIPESVTSIGSAFSGCSSLTSLHIPEGVTNTRIVSYAFRYCSSLTSINIPESVTNIENSAFESCTSLTSINIPERVTNIGERVFYDCSSLRSIYSFNTTAPTLGAKVFTNLPTNGTLHIKPGATGYDKWLSKLPSGWTIVEDL